MGREFVVLVLSLLAASVCYFKQGMFLSKITLLDKAEPKESNRTRPEKKVILLLVDALREDFVHMNDSIP